MTSRWRPPTWARMSDVLDVSGLEVRFGEMPAVRGLDLSVAAGEVLAVLGRNGAGKTTTLREIGRAHV